MNKEEIINKFIERRKDGIPDIFAGYCSSTRCNSCYLKNRGEQFCFERMFEILLDHIMELEETQKAETNLEHYIYVEYMDDNVFRAFLKPSSVGDFNESGSDDFYKWLLLPYKPPKPKYKLSKFEYDLLECYHTGYAIKDFWTLEEMLDKGYFKGIPTDAQIEVILDNCEVIQND